MDQRDVQNAEMGQPSSTPVKGILKKPTNSFQSGPTRLKWDEDNLMITEAQKDSTMKISEPKTPFIHYNSETDEVMNIDGIPPLDLPHEQDREVEDFSLDRDTNSESEHSSSSTASASRGRKTKHHVSVSDDDWDDEEKEDESEEAKERRRQFAVARSQHYNMRDAMRRARQMMERGEEDTTIGANPNADAGAVPPVPRGRRVRIGQEDKGEKEDDGDDEDDDVAYAYVHGHGRVNGAPGGEDVSMVL